MFNSFRLYLYIYIYPFFFGFRRSERQAAGEGAKAAMEKAKAPVQQKIGLRGFEAKKGCAHLFKLFSPFFLKHLKNIKDKQIRHIYIYI